jgi:hypothetical protein
MTGPICPDCRDGKHAICTGDAWDVELDLLTDCECTHNTQPNTESDQP